MTPGRRRSPCALFRSGVPGGHMKNVPVAFVRAVSSVAALGLVTVVPAVLLGQPAEPTAAEVVARMQQFYNTTSDYQAEFYQTYFNRLFNNYQRSQGKVFFKKP